MLSGKMPVFPYAIILIFREGQIANLNEIMGGKHPASSIQHQVSIIQHPVSKKAPEKGSPFPRALVCL